MGIAALGLGIYTLYSRLNCPFYYESCSQDWFRSIGRFRTIADSWLRRVSDADVLCTGNVAALSGDIYRWLLSLEKGIEEYLATSTDKSYA